MNKKIGLIFNGVWSQYTFAKAPKYVNIFELIYVYDITPKYLSQFDALIIPFQSNQKAIVEHKDAILSFLANGKKIFMEGDAAEELFDAKWEDRPVNNYWWVTNPDNPPIAVTDYSHPVYNGLMPRHACWHTHGVYTKVPQSAQIIQQTPNGEIITWQHDILGGTVLATTLDPIVEHGIQQITHLDNYTDKLIYWLCGVQPEGKFEFVLSDFGITV